MHRTLFACLLTLLPSAASAAQFTHCDWRASAEMLVEQWDGHNASVDGIHIALFDTGQPGSQAFHLLIHSPDPEGRRQCTLLSAGRDAGFGAIDFEGIAVEDTPDGIMLAINTFFFNVDIENLFYLHLIIDPEFGTIALEDHL